LNQLATKTFWLSHLDRGNQEESTSLHPSQLCRNIQMVVLRARVWLVIDLVVDTLHQDF
jgi:hypothetical protein